MCLTNIDNRDVVDGEEFAYKVAYQLGNGKLISTYMGYEYLRDGQWHKAVARHIPASKSRTNTPRPAYSSGFHVFPDRENAQAVIEGCPSMVILPVTIRGRYLEGNQSLVAGNPLSRESVRVQVAREMKIEETNAK